MITARKLLVDPAHAYDDAEDSIIFYDSKKSESI